MAISIPTEMMNFMDARNVPIRVLFLDLTITPNIFNFATRKVTISSVVYQPSLVMAGEFQSFGGSPADRIQLQVQNIDKAMSGFYHTGVLESAPAEVGFWYPQFEFKWTLLKGRVSLVSLDGGVANFEVRSRFDPAKLKIPRRIGQGLCPGATMDMFDDGPSTDADAVCPYRDVGALTDPGFMDCPGSMQNCEDRGMLDPANSLFYFAGMPIQSAVEEIIPETPKPNIDDLIQRTDDVIIQSLFNVI